MTSLGDLLSQWAGYLWDLFPLRVVKDWEQGVRTIWGQARAEVRTSENGIWGTGVHWFVPVVGTFEIEATATRTSETAVQNLTTKDHVAVRVSFAVTFKIRDLRMMSRRITDEEDSVLDRIRGAAGKLVPTLRWDELDQLPEKLEERVRSGELHGWGVNLYEVAPVDCVRLPDVWILGDRG